MHVAELVRALRAARRRRRVRCFGAAARRARTCTRYLGPAGLTGREPGPRHARRRPGDRPRRRRRRPRALAHLVRERRRAPRHAAVRRSRTSSRRTASSRCDRGRPSSSAAATASRAGSRRTAFAGRRRGHRGERRDAARTSCAAPLDLRPRDACRWCTTASNPRTLGLRSTTPCWCAGWASTQAARGWCFVGRITRQKGCRCTCSRRRGCCRPTCSTRACARRAGHPGDPGRGAGRRSPTLQAERTGWCGSTGCCARTSSPQVLFRADDVRLPVGLRAARHRQPRGDGVRRARSSAPATGGILGGRRRRR